MRGGDQIGPVSSCPSPKEMVSIGTPSFLSNAPSCRSPSASVRSPWWAASRSGRRAGMERWLTLRITRRYSRNGGEVYSATLGSLATTSRRRQVRDRILADRGRGDLDPAAAEPLDEERAGERGRLLHFIDLDHRLVARRQLAPD